MDENMNRDYGFGGNEENSAPQTENNSGYGERPVTPPTGYSQGYNPQYTYNSQANQYMPYGNYNYANNNQQPEKKSKGKKKGWTGKKCSVIMIEICKKGDLVL